MILQEPSSQVAMVAARLREIGFVARLRADQPVDLLLAVGDALLAVPLTAVEIPIEHPESMALLEAFRARFGAHLLLGVGRIETMQEGMLALAAGADFLLTNRYRTELHQWAERCGALYIPPLTAPAAAPALQAMGVRMATVTVQQLLATTLPNASNVLPALLATAVVPADLTASANAGAAAIAVGHLLFPTAMWSMPAMIRTGRALRRQWLSLQH